MPWHRANSEPVCHSLLPGPLCRCRSFASTVLGYQENVNPMANDTGRRARVFCTNEVHNNLQASTGLHCTDYIHLLIKMRRACPLGIQVGAARAIERSPMYWIYNVFPGQTILPFSLTLQYQLLGRVRAPVQ